MEIRCVKGMCGLKVVSSEKKLGFKGLINLTNTVTAELTNLHA